MMKTVAKTTTKRASLEPSTLVAYTILPSIPTSHHVPKQVQPIGAMMKKLSLQVHLIWLPMEGGAGRITFPLPMKGRRVHLTFYQQVHLMSHQATTRRTRRQVQLMPRRTTGHLLMTKRNWKGVESRGASLFTATTMSPSLVRG